MDAALDSRASAAERVGSPGRPVVLYLLRFVPTYVRWELEELARRGVPVRVVVSKPWSRATMWDRIGGSPVGGNGDLGIRVEDFHGWLSRESRSVAPAAADVLVRSIARHARTALWLAVRSLREGTFRHFLAAGWLAERFRGEPIARVHAHFAKDAADIGVLLARLLGVPFTVTTHAADIFVPPHRQRLRRLLERSSRVFTISDFNRRYLEGLIGPRLAPRLHVTRLGIDPAVLPPRAPSSDPFTIVCIASGLGEKKGVPDLIEACRILKERRFRFRCLIVGSDPEGTRRAGLQALVRTKGLGDQVSLVGLLPWRTALERVARAAVFVLPAIRTAAGDMDGIPVSLIEAMGIGVPVVSTRLSGIPELIEHGHRGLLVSPGDAQALASAVERIGACPELAASLGRRGREHVEATFTLSRYVDQVLDLWEMAPPARARVPGGGEGTWPCAH